MAKDKPCKCPDPPAAVPAWFMTYSDVITLLMTFFILLLTFATAEPEHFARMQVAMFGGGSSSGIAGKNDEPFDKNAVLMRIRPNSSRLTIRGSETPPIDTDPSYQSLDKGVQALEKPNELADSDRVSMTIPLSVVLDAQSSVTAIGQQQLRMIATQMRRMPLDVRMEVSQSQDVDACLKLVESLVTGNHISPGRVLVGAGVKSVPAGQLRLSLIRTKAGL
ncbi:MAG: flagellar motor protein MotB [Planctomycetaceae bacterium]